MRFIIILLVTQSVSAQILLFNGKIIDQVTKEPVAYAHVKFENSNIGGATSENGDFAMVIDESFLKAKVVITCLNYHNVYIDALALYEKNFELAPKIEKLPEVILGNYEPKEISIGTIKGKIIASHLHRRDTTMVAQYIKTSKIDSSFNYLKKVKIVFKNLILQKSIARIRIFDKDPIKGTPYNDLFKKSCIINITKKQEKYIFDFSELLIEVPEDGFFVAIEKIILPKNRCHIAPIERSTYPRYVALYKNKKRSAEIDESELLSFEKYRDEVTCYVPRVRLMERKQKYEEDYGDLYSFNSGKWEVYKKNLIMPIEVILSN